MKILSQFGIRTFTVCIYFISILFAEEFKKLAEALRKMIKDGMSDECSICLSEFDHPVSTFVIASSVFNSTFFKSKSFHLS